MKEEAIRQLLDAYEKAFNAGDDYVAQLYLDAASREMQKK
jgi:hypothetical protein